MSNEDNEQIVDGEHEDEGKLIRKWRYTLNNYTQAEYDAMLAVVCIYHVIGKEIAPTTATPHLQGFIYFASGRSFKKMKKLWPRVSFRTCKCSAVVNRRYCIKDGQFEETGRCPMTQGEKGETEVKAWKAAYDAVSENRLEDVRHDILCRSLKSIEYAVKRVKEAKLPPIPTKLAKLDNEWLWGGPDSGKSKRARKDNPDHYVKLAGAKWFDKYAYEKCVILDDVDESFAPFTQFIKNLADVYPVPVEVKNGSATIRPERVIVTSNLPPEALYHGVHLDAILKRFKVIHLVHDPNYQATESDCEKPSLAEKAQLKKESAARRKRYLNGEIILKN